MEAQYCGVDNEVVAFKSSIQYGHMFMSLPPFLNQLSANAPGKAQMTQEIGPLPQVGNTDKASVSEIPESIFVQDQHKENI